MKRKIYSYYISVLLIVMLSMSLNVNAFALESSTKIKLLPVSLNISIKNVDEDYIHDTNPLDDSQVNTLKLKDYSNNEINTMDYGDFKKLENTWKMTNNRIKIAKKIYPELNNIDIENWTNGDFMKYSIKTDNKRYMPNNNQISEFRNRNITLKDARYLLKIYATYENVLKESDTILIKKLKKYYTFKLNYVNILNENKSLSRVLLSGERFGTTYRQVYVPGYGADWFHEDSETHLDNGEISNAEIYGERATAIFNSIYGESYEPHFTNLWGTYSQSQDGAHEGIDMVGGYEPELRSPVDGTVIYVDSSIGKIAIETMYSGDLQTLFFNHLSIINVSSGDKIRIGDIIGNQGMLGNATGRHLHMEIENGSTAIQSSEHDDVLESAIPYYVLNIN